MRAFLIACVTTIILMASGYFLLNAFQEPTGMAYTAKSARIETTWSWRVTSIMTEKTTCTPRRSWQWFFVDFRDSYGEPAICAYSQ